MNLPYICAAVLNDGEAFIDQFTAERIRAPELVEFSSRVHVLADPEVDAQGDTARHQTRLAITLRDGRVLQTARDHAHGSSRDPMTEDEVRQKFRRLAASVLASDDVDELERVVDHLDTAQDLSGLVRLLGAVNPERG
jgi:aconitate decarboxylase